MYKFYNQCKARLAMRLLYWANSVKQSVFVLSIVFFSFQASAQNQSISLNEKNALLKAVLKKINQQSETDYIASNEIFALAKPVTIKVTNGELSTVLDNIFKEQPIQYELKGKIIVLSKKEILPKSKINQATTGLVSGYVTDTIGNSLPNTTVKNERSGLSTFTHKDGGFEINGQPGDQLIFSFIGFKNSSVTVLQNEGKVNVVLFEAPSRLNDIVVIGYGTTTKRFNTGTVASVSAAEIEQQPVTNVLSALSGKAPGVLIQTNNGLPGGNISVQVRGQGSIAAGVNPLYIIDGIPFSASIIASNDALGGNTINGAVSPLNSLNPNDIESITILKDADATAIYGSRGSNGVVLITTKKGKAGKTKVDATLSSGISQVANLPKLLNLQQYLTIRKEAYKNDGITPSSDPNDPGYAPDLSVWDTTRSTNWAKYLLGKTGHFSNYQASVSGGNQRTNFLVGGNYHTEGTVLPGDNLYTRGGMHANIQHTSENQKFKFQFNASYTSDQNKLTNLISNFSSNVLLPPNFPLYDGSGNYNYTFGYNPLASLSAVSKTNTENIILNGVLSYSIIKSLNFKISGGYNKINIDQVFTFPTNAQYQGSTNLTDFGTNGNKNFILEPQLDFTKAIGNGLLKITTGGTYQKTTRQSQFIEASNFSSDQLLENIGSATTFTARNYTIDYKYLSIFARANYNLADKYILDLSVRRDGSSRFGPGNQFGNFGAIGAAWLFASEKWWKDNIPAISYGKLRANYGITGNDQISDYQYLASYQSSGYTYQGLSGIQPARLYNANFHWETTHKLELALELGFFNDRLLLDVNRYDNRTKDQLVNYATPRLSGFSNYQANLPAVVENSGWEFALTSKNISTGKFNWTTSINLTLPKNKLIAFENLATSSYANTLVIGESITRIYGYQFVGLDQSGVPTFASKTGPSTTSPSSVTDQYYTLGKGYPDFYGGIANTFSIGRISMDVFGQFAKQGSMGGLIYTPGIIGNGYANLMDRWQKNGDVTTIPKASTGINYYLPYSMSSANYFNTSYFRLKNVALSYLLSSTILQRLKIDQFRVFVQGENLYTFWNRNNPVYDPETGSGINIPPMRTFTIGLQVTL